jgi:putative ABC transport system substrate-binding protein
MKEKQRRAFLIASGALLAAPLVRAQHKGRTFRVAFVITTSPAESMRGPSPTHVPTQALLQALRNIGYIDGQNLIFDPRSAEGDPSRYPEIMANLIRLKTDVIILVPAVSLVKTAQAATRTVPIVLLGYEGDPIAHGIVKSYLRPGGNITGLVLFSRTELGAKILQLFKEAVPGLKRVVFLGAAQKFPPDSPFMALVAKLGIELLPVQQHPTDPTISFSEVTKLRPDGVWIDGTAVNYHFRHQLGRLAWEARLPAICAEPEVVQAGALLSYAVITPDWGARIANYVDRILKGANPGDLAMEQASKFELTINLDSAKHLGISVPPSLILRADRVIESK